MRKRGLNNDLKVVSDSEEENEGLTAERYTPFLSTQKGRHLKVVPPCVYADPVLDYFNNDTVK
jgi:hypothetical protein